MNKGMESHHHSLSTMSLLYDYHWNMELLGRVKDELQLAVDYLKEHLMREKCMCGDLDEDVAFYSSLLEQIKEAIQKEDYSAIPWVQEQLHAYVTKRDNVHPCISWLLNFHHSWVWDAKI